MLRLVAGPEGWQEEGKLLPFASPSLGFFDGAKGEGFVCSKVTSLNALKEVRELQWQQYLDGQIMAGFRWRVLHKLPRPKRSGDLRGVLHGTLGSNSFISKVDRSVGDGCVFCNIPEAVHHVFIECHLLLSL